MPSQSKKNPHEIPAGRLRRSYRRLGRGGRILVWSAAALLFLVFASNVGSHLFDEPLRHTLESRINQHLRGYRVKVGHAHAGLFGLSLWLDDLVVWQEANPQPPVARIPYLHLSVEWPALLGRHLVGDAFFSGPQIHIDLPQIKRELADRLTPRQRGWQQAIESIYPFKVNRLRVKEGSITYVDIYPQRPFQVTHWNLQATNIRNILVPDHVYPSEVHSDGFIFDTGRGRIDGNANFLSQPFPGVRAHIQLTAVPLDKLQPIGQRSNLLLRGGTLTTRGEVEYSPRFKLAQVNDFQLDGVSLDYVHDAPGALSEKDKYYRLEVLAHEANVLELSLRMDQLHLTHGSVGFIDRAVQPNYRIFVDQADLEMRNLSNRAAQKHGEPSYARLRGRFMGSGTALVEATFQPEGASHAFGAEVTVRNSSLPALNDMLRAYQKIGASSGTVSIYSQVEVRNGYLRGYVKPLFSGVEIADPPSTKNEPLGTRIKQKVAEGLAHLLKNRGTQQVATRADISGSLSAPHTSPAEIFSGLLRNAFFKAVLPGLDKPEKPGAAKPGR